MDYFKEVYLKRMNIDGHTRQERVLTRKEKEFDKLFLQQSQWQAGFRCPPGAGALHSRRSCGLKSGTGQR